jgi:hypothetical protein
MFQGVLGYIPPDSHSTNCKEQPPISAELRFREDELRYYNRLEPQLRVELHTGGGQPLAAINNMTVQPTVVPNLRSSISSPNTPCGPVHQWRQAAISQKLPARTEEQRPQPNSAVGSTLRLDRTISRSTVLQQTASPRRAIPPAIARGLMVDATTQTTTVVREFQYMKQEGLPAARISTTGASAKLRPSGRKSVHWRATAKLTGTQPAGIMHSAQQLELWTVPFRVALTICAHQYTIPFGPTKANTASINRFENGLLNAVHQEHRDTLQAFLKYEYTLSFDRLLRTSNTIIPTGERELSDAVLQTFLNAVTKNAMVSLL